MAVSGTTFPQNWGRINDNNRLNYTFSSNKYTQPNFNFYFELYKYDANNTSSLIGSFIECPNSNGICYINPSSVYRNYLSYSLDLSKTTLTEATSGATRFQIKAYDYYSVNGAAPAKQGAAWVEQNTTESGMTGIYLYNGCQQHIAYDNPTIGSSNYQWVITGSTSGKYLTDASEFYMDNSDYGFLYFLADPSKRPTRAKYTVYYCNITGWQPDPGGGSAIDAILGPILGEKNDEITTQSMTTSNQQLFMDDKIDGFDPYDGIDTHPFVWSYTKYDDFTYNYGYSLQHYFPVGPVQLFQKGIILSGNTNNWLRVKVDLYSGTTQMNKNSFYIYNKPKCDKYGRYQLFWLNPHGGFDTYTFDRKNNINYKIKKSTYKQRMLPNYSFYDAGERVFDTEVTEEITLRSNNLTQKEAQLLTQLAQSPVVYVVKTYRYNPNSTSVFPYAVPYIITNEEVPYPQKVNDKEIYMELTIRPANEKIIQKN